MSDVKKLGFVELAEAFKAQASVVGAREADLHDARKAMDVANDEARKLTDAAQVKVDVALDSYAKAKAKAAEIYDELQSYLGTAAPTRHLSV